MPTVSTLVGLVRYVAWTSTPGVETCCCVSLRMFKRNTLIGKNVDDGAGNCTGSVFWRCRFVRWKCAATDTLRSHEFTA